MLRLWRDLYRIVLHPERISLVRVRRARSSKAREVSAALEIPAGKSPTWQAALDHLDELIAGIRSNKADVEVVLSNHYVRYAVVPWSSEVTDAAETGAMTGICFEQVYGDLVAEWEIRLSHARYGESRLASAIDRELLRALSEVFERTSLRLVSVQPCLMTAFNHCREKIPDEDYLFMLDEPGRLCLLQVNNRQCSQIRVSPVVNLADELPGILNREVMLNGLDMAIKKYRYTLECIHENSPLPDMEMLSSKVANAQPATSLRSA